MHLSLTGTLQKANNTTEGADIKIISASSEKIKEENKMTTNKNEMSASVTFPLTADEFAGLEAE